MSAMSCCRALGLGQTTLLGVPIPQHAPHDMRPRLQATLDVYRQQASQIFPSRTPRPKRSRSLSEASAQEHPMSWSSGAAAAEGAATLTREQVQGREASKAPEPDPPKELSTATETQPHKVSSPYVWSQNWWPVLPEEMMHRDKPNAITLLGRELVVWWNQVEGQWTVMEDSCPHRLTPLSQGRIISPGTLTCSYHGWSFNSQGTCTSIPQLDPTALPDAPGASKTPTTAAAAGKLPGTSSQVRASQLMGSKKTCARTYPSRLVDDLLFVWLDDSPEGLAKSKLKQIPLAGNSGPSFWGVNQTFNDYPFWMEQSMDPSHGSFLHHGFVGFRMDNVVPIHSEVTELTLDGGFTMYHGGYDTTNQGMKAVRDFVPPSFTTTVYDYASGMSIVLLIFVVPVEPGQTRTFFKTASGDHLRPRRALNFPAWPSSSSSAPASETAPKPPAPSFSLTGIQAGIKRLMMTWLFRFLSSLPHWANLPQTVVDQDTVAMHYTEHIMRKKGQTDRDFTLVAASDAGVVAMDRWMRMAGYKDLWKGRRQPELASLEKLLDRKLRHVDMCAVCQKGLRDFETACSALHQAVFLGTATFIALAALAALPGGPGGIAGKPAALVGTVTAVLAVVLSRVQAFKEERFKSGVHAWKQDGGLSMVKPV